MCTHQRSVYNPYTHSTFMVKCGKCKSCLQEKAYKRSYRIKCEVNPDTLVLFCTLTYDRSSCPFVFQSDLDKRAIELNVYREHSTRRVRIKTDSGLKYYNKRNYTLDLLGTIYDPNYESFDKRNYICHLSHRRDKIGVCYYQDLVDFRKRLQINLKRKYGFTKSFKMYACSEYGEQSARPHFHLLVFIQPCDETLFRTAISEAWPFANHRRTEKYIEIARDAANYVASYVNSGSNVHGFLSANFKAKSSYSKDFGMADKLFSLDSILQKIQRRDLSYLRGVGGCGKEQYFNFQIPKYVINRYFPLFKGYSRFTDSEVLDVLLCFTGYSNRLQTPLISLDKLLSIDYTKEDVHRVAVRLSNAYKKFCRLSHRQYSEASLYDYVYTFREAWKVYKATGVRLWYEDDSVDIKYKYDNSCDLKYGLVYSPELYDKMQESAAPWIWHVNDYPQNKNITAKYTSIYDFRCKEKRINNAVMSANHYYF